MESKDGTGIPTWGMGCTKVWHIVGFEEALVIHLAGEHVQGRKWREMRLEENNSNNNNDDDDNNVTNTRVLTVPQDLCIGYSCSLEQSYLLSPWQAPSPPSDLLTYHLLMDTFVFKIATLAPLPTSLLFFLRT